MKSTPEFNEVVSVIEEHGLELNSHGILNAGEKMLINENSDYKNVTLGVNKENKMVALVAQSIHTGSRIRFVFQHEGVDDTNRVKYGFVQRNGEYQSIYAENFETVLKEFSKIIQNISIASKKLMDISKESLTNTLGKSDTSI